MAYTYQEKLEPHERETSISHVGDEKEWRLFTNERAYIAKMASYGVEPYMISGDSHFYKLTMDQVLLRKGKKKRVLTADAKEKLQKRMAEVRDKK